MNMLTLAADKACVVKAKGGERQRQQRLVWTSDALRLRVDLTIGEGGTTSESWALHLGSTLYAFGGKITAEDLVQTLREGFELTKGEAATLALNWLGEAHRTAHEATQEGRAWARARQTRKG